MDYAAVKSEREFNTEYVRDTESGKKLSKGTSLRKSPQGWLCHTNVTTPIKLGGGAGEAAAGFNGGAAFAALRAVFGLVGGDR
jgi:hypothetical protein